MGGDCTASLGAVAEVTFWWEFSTRFNFIAVDYLVYTQEVIGNIRESYPVPWILAGIAAAALLVVLVLRRFVRLSVSPRSALQRVTLAALAILLPVASLVVTNLDQMNGSGNAYADELSGNGLYSFVAAYRRNELEYDRFYRTLPQAQADAILLGLGVERQPLSEALKPDEVEDPVLQMGPFKRRPRNVVLISVESLSAEFLGAYGSKAGLTPNLDRLASEGLRFTRFFATGTRTVRGLEALSLGLPPVPGQSIVRRPGNEHLATVGEILEHQGRHISFIYGGYGYFDNMNAYFSGNDYEIYDRKLLSAGERRIRKRVGCRGRGPVCKFGPALRQGERGRPPVLCAYHDDVEPSALHLPGRAHRHPVARRAGGRRQIYGLRNRQVHRRGAYAALVRRHPFHHHCRSLRSRGGQDPAADEQLPHSDDHVCARARGPRAVYAPCESDRCAADDPRSARGSRR